jgi:hypothetical protein
MEADDLTSAAARLSAILGESALLIGGLAVSAWGFVRATEDIDFVSSLEPDALQDRLTHHQIPTELRRGDVLGGDIPWVIHGKIGSVSFHVLPPLVSIDWENATRVTLPGGGELLIVALADLIKLKLRAGGPRDLWDVAELLRRYPEMRDDAREWASGFDRLEELDSWLNDPRLG